MLFIGQMTAMKGANKELKGMMKTVKLEDIDVCYLAFLLLPDSSCFQYSHLTCISNLLLIFLFD